MNPTAPDKALGLGTSSPPPDAAPALKHADNELRVAQLIAENMPGGVYICHLEDVSDDRSLRMVYANPMVRTLTGLVLEDVIGKTLDESFPGLRAKGVPQRYAEVVRSQTVIRLEDMTYGDDLVRLSTFRVRAFPLPGNHVGVAFENITTRNWAPTDAGDSEALSAAILNNIGAYIFLKDTSYRYTYVNRQVAQLFAQPAEDIIGRTGVEFFPPEVFAEIMKSDRAVVEQGERIEREESGFVTPSGPRAFWTVKLPLRDAHGVISGLVGIATDVTDLERAKERLREREARLLESEERFRVAQEVSPDGFTILRPIRNDSGEVVDFAWVYENRTIARLNGTDPQTIIGKRLLELFPAHKGTSILEAYVRVAVTGERQIIGEVPVGHLISSPTWLRLVVVPAGQDIAVLAEDITERKRAQEDLRRSEAHYRRMFHSNPQPMWVYDLETLRFVAVNEAAVDHYGYSRDEFLAMTIADIRPPEDLPCLYKNLEALPAEGVDHAGVWQHLTKDGSVIEVEITSHLLEFDGRRSELVLAHDITARRQVERALRDSNERLQKVLEIETVGVMFWDLTTGCMTDANGTFLNMMGYSREDVNSRSLTWQKFTPPEYVEASLAEIEKFHATGRVGPYEKEYLRKDGTRLWLLFAGSSLGGDSAVEFCVDISDRLSAQTALRESEERFRATFQQAAVGVALVNPDGRWLQVNQKLCDIVGYSREDLMSRTFQDITHPDDLDADLRYVRQMLDGEIKTYSIEKRYVRKDGSLVWINLSVALVRGDTGLPNYFISIVEDISERKRIGTELQQKLAELHQWYEVMLGREARVIELKREANALARELGRPPPYDLAFVDDSTGQAAP